MEKINNTYSRRAKLILNDSKEIPLTFVKHPSTYFSWQKWHGYFKNNCGQTLEYLAEIAGIEAQVGGQEILKNMQVEPNNLRTIPMGLKHKPVVAADYPRYTDNEHNDVKYLSIGRATYDNQQCSIKLIRKLENGKWARNSEEIPVERVPDLTLMLVSMLKNIDNLEKEKNLDQSILEEEIVNPDDIEWLKNEISNREVIITALKNLKDLLNDLPQIK